VIVRRAKPGDERAIAEFAIKLFEQHVGYDPDRFSLFATVEGAESFYGSQFDEPGARILVAEVNGRVVGFAYIAKEDRNYAELLENGAWLHDIYVEEASRSTGAGHALIKGSIEAAREMGAEKVVLTVAARNSAARSFFEGVGFRPTMTEMTLNLADISND
jgi:GNAT superfamily N-acetyltransferase